MVPWCSSVSEQSSGAISAMHNAPPVAFPVGRFLWGRVAWLGVVMVSALGLLAWSHLAHLSSGSCALAWSIWGLCGAGSAVWARRQTLSKGRLFWSGETWSWQSPDGEGPDLQLTVGLDVGRGILLFLRLDKGADSGWGPWLCAWVSEGSMPSKWHGFRCAVYSRPKAADTIDEPGA